MARVLIVDDARFMRRVVGDVLRAGGHEVVGEADDGTTIVDLFDELRPDVVTLDITMPGQDGLAVLRDLLARHPEARIVMCSAIGQEPTVVEAIRMGARDFVVKPFSAERLTAAVESALAH